MNTSPEKGGTKLVSRNSMRSGRGSDALGHQRQFKYGRLGEDSSPVHQNREGSTVKEGVATPVRPAPGWPGARPLAYKSMPDLQSEANHVKEDSLIDLTVSPVESRHYINTGIGGAISSSSLLDQSIGDTNTSFHSTG